MKLPCDPVLYFYYGVVLVYSCQICHLLFRDGYAGGQVLWQKGKK